VILKVDHGTEVRSFVEEGSNTRRILMKRRDKAKQGEVLRETKEERRGF
jgi:hypothetical protein